MSAKKTVKKSAERSPPPKPPPSKDTKGTAPIGEGENPYAL